MDEDMLALAAASLQRGDWADARDAYQRALAAGEDAATLEGLAYACWWLQDDVTTIDSRCRAFRLYLDAHDPMSAARVAIAACERVRDVGRAAEWCQRLRELSERWAFELMIAVCRTHYASTLVARGQWREAEREFQAAIAGFGRPHRGQAAEALVRLADLRVRQGRLDDAAELLDRVDSGPAHMLGHTIARAVRAALLLESGDPHGAVDTAETFLRAMPGPESLERAPALEILVRANIDLGDEPGARAALAGLRTLADLVRTQPMMAAASLAQGAVTHAFADAAAARIALLDAVDQFAVVDAPYERAQALLVLAACLAGSDRRAAARTHGAEALHIAQALGARSLVRRARDLLADLGTAPAPEATPFADLTRRKAEILRLIARGSGNHDIAAQLVISVRTVERHISNIYLKLGLEGPRPGRPPPPRHSATAWCSRRLCVCRRTDLRVRTHVGGPSSG